MGTDVSREIARTYLRDIEPPWKRFWFHMHRVAKNLAEFGEGLAAVDDDAFVYHTAGQKNDISAWVREVVGDSVLADELQKVKRREEAAALVRERVATLRKAAGGEG